MPLLSVAIITCDEERNLARTLASVRFADEVIVVADTFDHADRLQSYQRAGRVAAKIVTRSAAVEA